MASSTLGTRDTMVKEKTYLPCLFMLHTVEGKRQILNVHSNDIVLKCLTQFLAYSTHSINVYYYYWWYKNKQMNSAMKA